MAKKSKAKISKTEIEELLIKGTPQAEICRIAVISKGYCSDIAKRLKLKNPSVEIVRQTKAIVKQESIDIKELINSNVVKQALTANRIDKAINKLLTKMELDPEKYRVELIKLYEISVKS